MSSGYGHRSPEPQCCRLSGSWPMTLRSASGAIRTLLRMRIRACCCTRRDTTPSQPVQWEVEALEPVELQRLAAVAPTSTKPSLPTALRRKNGNANGSGHSLMGGLPTAHRALISRVGSGHVGACCPEPPDRPAHRSGGGPAPGGRAGRGAAGAHTCIPVCCIGSTTGPPATTRTHEVNRARA